MDTAENIKYRGELEKIIRKLHPDVVKIEWSSFLLRGPTPGENNPAVCCFALSYGNVYLHHTSHLTSHPPLT